MTSIDICRCGKNVWEEICRRVNKAVVFLDATAAEALHWNGGPMMLFNNGALNIKQFSSFESGAESEKKALFVLSGPLKGQNSAVMQDILHESHFQYAIVYSGLSPAMHTLVQFGGMEDEMKAFHTHEELLLEWMGNMNYTAEVYSIPLLTAPISPHLFVLPEHSDFMPLLPIDIQEIHKMQTEEQQTPFESRAIVYTDLPREAQLQYKLLVCGINSALEQWSVAEDVFCLGPTSRMLASELAGLPWAKARRKNGRHKASLLLVDRTLDLASACGHHSDTLLDRVVRCLSPFEGHANDVKINMTPLCSVPCDAEGVIVSGCLGHSSDPAASNLLHSLVTSKHKEGLMEVNRQVVEAAASCALPVKLSGRPGRVTADQLQSTLQLFKGKSDPLRKHCGLLQIAQGVWETLQDPASGRQDGLLALEKGLVQGLGEASAGEILSQLTQIVTKEIDRSASERSCSLEDLFVLIVYVYSLAGTSALTDPEQERLLVSALCMNILDTEEDLPQFLTELIGEGRSESKVTEVVEEIFTKLKSLSEVRNQLKQFRQIYDAGDVTSPGSLRPLLKQVLESVLDPAKPDLPDVEYISTGFRDLLKSGFGLFRNVSKARPNDHPILIVFVVGGVTASEVRLVKETVGKNNLQVIVGSTCLLKPKDVLHRLFTQDKIHPPTSVL